MRVPLIVHAPKRYAAKSISEPVSVLDIAPTLIEMAGGDKSAQSLAHDGVSLLANINSDSNPSHTVFGEYVGEGSIDPMIMVREGDWKFNYCEVDPPQLFNLKDDPLELNNLADSEQHQALLEKFSQQIHQKWDIAKFRTDVLRSQKNRLAVYHGLRKGQFQAWDFQPQQDATNRFMRNHLDLNVLEAQARFPREKSKE